MLISPVGFVILLIVEYFPWLLFIGLVLSIAFPPVGRRATWAACFPLLLIAVGLLGAIHGVPMWMQYYDYQRARGQHFAMRCDSAELTLPPAPLEAAGIVWRHPSAAGHSRLTARDNPDRFTDVAGGGYGELETIDQDGKVRSIRWRPIDAGRWETHVQPLTAPTLRYELFHEDIADDRDMTYKLHAVRTTIVDRVDGTVVARRAVYAQEVDTWSDGVQRHRKTEYLLCPKSRTPQESCPADGCTALDFVTSVVRPLLPADHRLAFHLYRGIGERTQDCWYRFTFGPGIHPEDVEWWTAKGSGGRDLHLRIRGTSDHVVCPSSLSEHGSLRLTALGFYEGHRQYSAEALRWQYLLGSTDAPLGLAATLRDMAKIVEKVR